MSTPGQDISAVPPVVSLTSGKEEIIFTKKSVSVGVDIKEGKVVKIYPFSELLGHIFTGDFIDSINGQKVSNTAELIRLITSNVPGKITIEYRRDEHCTYHLKPLPSRRVGYELFEITLVWRSGGTPVGLLIHRDFNGQVIVSMVESGSTASRAVRAGDHLIRVNNKEVTDRDLARKAINESVNLSRRVVLVLERSNPNAPPPPSVRALPEATVPHPMPPPVTSAASSAEFTPTMYGAPPPSDTVPPALPPPVTSAASSAEFTPTTYGAPPPSVLPSLTSIMASSNAPVNKTLDVILPPDVLAIMEANKDFFMKKCILPSCLKKGKEPLSAGRVDMPVMGADESPIPFDPSPKPLKATPKRVGS